MLVLKWKERAFIKKWTPDVFVDFRRPYWWTKTVHRLWRLIQSFTKVHETFRQITQKLWATKTWNLDKSFIFYYFITFHFLGFFHWTVSNLYFWCVTVKTIYICCKVRPGLFREWLQTMVSTILAGYKLACEQALCLGKNSEEREGKGAFRFSLSPQRSTKGQFTG